MRSGWAYWLILGGLFMGCADASNRTVGPEGFDPAGDGDGDTGGKDAGDDDPMQMMDGSMPDPFVCTPKTCDELGKNCGFIADGCGDVVDCGGCGTDEACGLLEHNECATFESLCVPLSMDEACAGKECGQTADGCGTILDCGSCGSDELCGLDAPFTCGTLPVSTPDTCVAQVASCAAAGKECGKIGNGCGNLIDCDAELGGCTGGEFCGLGGPEMCGAPPACVPLTADQACPGKCGMVSDGCEPVGAGTGLIDCNAVLAYQCPGGQSCGGGGVPNQCGSGGGACQALSKATACGAAVCGKAGDGCGGSYDCGNMAGACAAADLCTNGSCVPMCTPSPMATACAGKSCGQVGDGCGGSYTCGACGPTQTCGLFTAYQCGTTPPAMCQPMNMATACAGKECGTVYDGCGTAVANQINCGSCTSGQYCGISTAFQCDLPPPPSCTPATSCAMLGWACGTAVDSCGNLFDCASEGRSCNPVTQTCVGGITGPTTCQTGTGGGTMDCDVCDSIPDCSGMPQVTKLTGRVITPGKADNNTPNQVGVPNAFVYILRNNDPTELPPISSGIPAGGTSCDRCSDQDLGPVLVSATTNAKGEFELSGDIPLGEQIVLVTKIGKWRRAVQVTVAANNACATSSVATVNTRLPRTRTDGLGVNIPRIAVSTGRVDAMECVFHKLGVATAEFARPNANATNAERVHMYRSDDVDSGNNNAPAGGASMSGGSEPDPTLWGALARMSVYDMVVFDCEGATYDESGAAHTNVREYVNRGGRMFASHFSYNWISASGGVNYVPATFYDTRLNTSSVAGTGSDNSGTGYVSIGRPAANAAKIPTFSAWLINEGAATQTGSDVTFTITDPRDLAASANPPSEEFVYRYPPGNDNDCSPCTSLNQTNCTGNSAQCNWTGAACVAKTPATANCSSLNAFNCNSNPPCTWTGLLGPCAGGTYPVTPTCNVDNHDACVALAGCGWTKTSVQQYSFNTPYTAPSADICGRVAYSGFHVAGNGTFNNETFPNHCNASNGGSLTAQEKVLLYALFDLSSCVTTGGPPTPPSCTPSSTQTLCAGKCGDVPDGCGDTVTCGMCPAGQVCGANNTCGPATCNVTTCGAQGATCGVIANGCGGTLNCQPCPSGQVCGLVTPNQCATTCTPIGMGAACAGKCGFVSDGCGSAYDCPDCSGGQVCVNNMCTDGSCSPANACPGGLDCGLVSDGCDGVLDCGDCTLPEVCGAGGQANVCGSVDCTPLDCAALGADCGWIGDGCGGSANCGVCDPGQACGVGGPNKCGGCVPKTCGDLGAECGMVGNACGGSVDCGACTVAGEVCGAVQANKCDPGPACNPQSCGDVSAECGLIGDGCGDLVDCGTCPPGEVCSILSPNQCDPPPACPAVSCDDQGAECGSIGDGCGALLNCGPCPPGAACGIVAPNKCSSVG